MYYFLIEAYLRYNIINVKVSGVQHSGSQFLKVIFHLELL